MGQIDRHECNITFCRKRFSTAYRLSPIYDFEISYRKYTSNEASIYYINPFIKMIRDADSLKKVVREYHNIMESIDILKNIKIADALECISSETGCVFTDKEIAYYKDRDNENTKILKKI